MNTGPEVDDRQPPRNACAHRRSQAIAAPAALALGVKMSNNYEWRLVVEPLSEKVEDRILTELDAGIDVHASLTIVNVQAPGESAVSAGRTAVEQLRSLGARVVRAMPDVVHAAAIARRAGVSKTSVTGWVNDSPTTPTKQFPAPFIVTEQGPMWMWGDVNEWLRRDGTHHYDSWCTPVEREISQVNTWIAETNTVQERTFAAAGRTQAFRQIFREQVGQGAASYVPFSDDAWRIVRSQAEAVLRGH